MRSTRKMHFNFSQLPFFFVALRNFCFIERKRNPNLHKLTIDFRYISVSNFKNKTDFNKLVVFLDIFRQSGIVILVFQASVVI